MNMKRHSKIIGSALALVAGIAWCNIAEAALGYQVVGYKRSDGVNAVVQQCGTGAICELSLSNGKWSMANLTAITGSRTSDSSAISAYVRSDNTDSVLYSGTNSYNVYELYLTGGTWSSDDLSTVAGAPSYAGFVSSGYARTDGVNSVVFRGWLNGHVYEMFQTAGIWRTGDLTALTGAPAAAGDPYGYARSDGVNSVLFTSSDGHIHELYLSGGTWHTADLTAFTGAPAAADDPSGYVRSDRVNSVLFTSSDGHIHELYLSGGTWRTADLTAFTGAQTALGHPRGYARSDGVSSVVFVGSDHHVHEIYLSGGIWRTADLTVYANDPYEVISPPSPYVRSDNVNAVVYMAYDNHVHELSLNPSIGKWTWADLTAAAGH